ncbi:TonB-dependent receptor plug domain-containing protein [Marinobacterium sediminicola]|uniref:Iron complex outermembrane recepter protein n=1 Tax=Marinobacterium sediminicola TaxID=518898 RepID=A0ABY1S374_9GAMM|nr:TonB-dependent receptor [Marinobacterium sediminicola]ULG68867.1 TonB-dependent receptor [Marinobacterium sediminicola]SMR77523.1 iron complex outermembrane recepter protein [Marinobacterium sediminicola]
MIFRGSRCPLYLAPLLGIGLFAQPSQANETFYLNEQAFLTEIPEITSATRLSQRLTESPASISIITRDMISASGARNIPDLMRLVPGFQSYHVSANKFATTYHGASDDFPRRLEVMVDGRSVYLPLLATVDWTSLGINLEDIDRIEVVRGSNVPTQGSNAFMGSINVITREPAAEQGGYVNVTGGSMDTRELRFGHTDTLGLWSYRLSGGHGQNEGSDLFEDGMKHNYLSFSGSYTPTLTDTLWIQAGVDRGYTDVGQADDADNQYNRRDHNASYQSIKYQNLYSDTGTLQLTAYHNYLDLSTDLMSRQYLIEEEGIPEELVDAYRQVNTLREDSEHGTSHTYDTELQITERIKNFDLVGGLGYRREQIHSDVLLQSGGVSEDRWRAFGNLDWQLTQRWNLNSGLMYEDSSEGNDAFSYRNAVMFHPSSQQSWRLSYSISERLPSLLERYGNAAIFAPTIAGLTNDITVYDYDASTNPDLKPERIKTLELGYYLAFEDNRGYLDARVFHERIRSGISSAWRPYDPSTDFTGLDRFNYQWLEPNDPDNPYTGIAGCKPEIDARVRQQDNISDINNSGVEFQFKHQPTSSFWYLLNYAYTDNDVKNWDQGPESVCKAFGQDDSLTPLHTASLMLNWEPTGDLNLSLMHYYMDSVDWLEGGWRNSYQRTDLRAAHNWQLGADTELEASVTVQNAFGPTYAEFYEYNLFDRRVWLQLMLRYH